MGGQGQPQLDGGGGREGQLDHVADALLGDEVVHDAHAQPLLDHGDGGEVLQRGEADVGCYAIAGEEGADVVVPPERGHDDRVIGAPLDRIGVRPREGVILWQDGDHGVLGQTDPVVGHRLLSAEEGQVRDPLVQPAGDLLSDPLAQLDADLGVVLLEGAVETWVV